MVFELVDFTPKGIGLLSPDSVRFFYYTVAKGELENECVLYEWNGEIEAFLSKKGLIVKPCKNNTVPQDFEENTMEFEIGYVYDKKEKKKKKETTAMAFIRHIRNAFAHYIIEERDGFFYMIDKIPQSGRITMRGQIGCEDLKKLCFLLLKQAGRYNK